MYHMFTIIYITLLLSKAALLVTFSVYQLGQRALDIAIICGPALCLILELHCESDTGSIRGDHRLGMQRFDMFLQALFVIKVAVGFYRGESGRTIMDFVKSRVSIGPYTYA